MLQGKDQTRKGSAEARSEQLGCNTPDLHSTEGDSKIRNQKEYEGRGPGVQQPSEAAPERTLDGGQRGGDTDDLTQPKRSRTQGESRCSSYTAIYTDYH